jgi:hypothetical protein
MGTLETMRDRARRYHREGERDELLGVLDTCDVMSMRLEDWRAAEAWRALGREITRLMSPHYTKALRAARYAVSVGQAARAGDAAREAIAADTPEYEYFAAHAADDARQEVA